MTKNNHTKNLTIKHTHAKNVPIEEVQIKDAPTPHVMTETKRAKDKYNEISNAVVHVIWIVIFSVAIILVVNEIFHGSMISNAIILILISAYIIFSFARKFWVETKPKKIMEAIDVTLTLVGGFFLIMVAQQPTSNPVGYALAKNMVGGAGSEPHIGVFFVGVMLLVVGAIRIYIINKNKIQHRLPQ